MVYEMDGGWGGGGLTTWLVPNWISNPSSVRAGGMAMIPALFIRISNRSLWARKVSAAFLVEERDARSSSRYSTKSDAFGTAAEMPLIATSYFSNVLAQR